jgi:hypothetical protein
MQSTEHSSLRFVTARQAPWTLPSPASQAKSGALLNNSQPVPRASDVQPNMPAGVAGPAPTPIPLSARRLVAPSSSVSSLPALAPFSNLRRMLAYKKHGREKYGVCSGGYGVTSLKSNLEAEAI